MTFRGAITVSSSCQGLCLLHLGSSTVSSGGEISRGIKYLGVLRPSQREMCFHGALLRVLSSLVLLQKKKKKKIIYSTSGFTLTKFFMVQISGLRTLQNSHFQLINSGHCRPPYSFELWLLGARFT